MGLEHKFVLEIAVLLDNTLSSCIPQLPFKRDLPWERWAADRDQKDGHTGLLRALLVVGRDRSVGSDVNSLRVFVYSLSLVRLTNQ